MLMGGLCGKGFPGRRDQAEPCISAFRRQAFKCLQQGRPAFMLRAVRVHGPLPSRLYVRLYGACRAWALGGAWRPGRGRQAGNAGVYGRNAGPGPGRGAPQGSGRAWSLLDAPVLGRGRGRRRAVGVPGVAPRCAWPVRRVAGPVRRFEALDGLQRPRCRGAWCRRSPAACSTFGMAECSISVPQGPLKPGTFRPVSGRPGAPASLPPACLGRRGASAGRLGASGQLRGGPGAPFGPWPCLAVGLLGGAKPGYPR